MNHPPLVRGLERLHEPPPDFVGVLHGEDPLLIGQKLGEIAGGQLHQNHDLPVVRPNLEILDLDHAVAVLGGELGGQYSKNRKICFLGNIHKKLQCENRGMGLQELILGKLIPSHTSRRTRMMSGKINYET